MESIYETMLCLVTQGSKFNVDLKSRSLKVDGKFIIKDGNYSGLLWDFTFNTIDEVLKYLEVLYLQYKHSVPSERSDSRRYVYFKAVKEKDLADTDLMYGQPREVAQYMLEMALLCSIIDGTFIWWDDPHKWFWRSEVDRDFVIYRDWIL